MQFLYSNAVCIFENQMQFVYLRTGVQRQSVVQVKYSLQLDFIFCRNPQKKRKKTNQQIKCSQTVLQICDLHFLMLLCAAKLPARDNINPQEKNTTPQFTNFHLLTPLFESKEDFYIFHPPAFLTKLLPAFFSWKTKLKCTGVDIMPFFQDAKYSLKKDKKCHCVKSVRIRRYSGPHFPAFGLNIERTSEQGHFSCSVFIESVLWNQ